MKTRTVISIITILYLEASLIGCKDLKRPIYIADPVLEKTIREEISKPTGKLTYGDVSEIEALFVNGRNKSAKVKTLKGIENLTALKELYLLNNLIVDISPIIKNSGLNSDTLVVLLNNRIPQEQIKALEKRGVAVIFF